MNNAINGNFPKNIYNDNNINTFNPLSTNSMNFMNQNMGNFKKTFESPTPLIDKIDYTNSGNLLHNNIGDNILDETVIEYRINIDSIDRDLKSYPDPLNFSVKFAPSSPSYIDNTKFNAPAYPHILKEFKNVKYIKLENIILPRYTKIGKRKDEYEFDQSSTLLDERFINLVIKEIDCDNTFTTGDDSNRFDKKGRKINPPKPFAIIIPDKVYGSNFFTGTPCYGTKVFKNSLLGNLKNMTIQLYDSCGCLLKYNDLYSYRDLEKAEANYEPIPIFDIRHPLNKKIQVHLSFIIGVVESQINTNTQY